MIESLQFQSKRHFWIASSKTPRNDTVYGPSLRATAKQSSTIENHAKHFSAVAYINTLLATELKLLAMIMLYWIASRSLAMTLGVSFVHQIIKR